MKKVVGLLFGLIAGAANASPITIDFDELPTGMAVDAHYAGLGVTFVNAFTGSTFGLPGGTHPISLLHMGTFYQPQADNPIEASFSSDVSTVSLTGIDVGENGFMLSAFDGSNSLLATTQIFGTGSGSNQFFTLSLAAAGIRHVAFSQVLNTGSGDGLIFDNFTFDIASVPEPASLILLGLGIAGCGISRRKKFSK